MNPYGRFTVVSNALSAAVVLALMATAAKPILSAYETANFESALAPIAASALGLGVVVMVWLALTDAVLPFFFRYTPIRRLILGKHFIEGTWMQAEKHDGKPRMAVIEIQPAGSGFRFSGYAVDDSLDVQSNVVLEFSRFDWPFMTYKFRNSLADTAEEGREGIGEIHFEANRNAPRSYNGFVQTVNKVGRVKTEGVRLTKGREIRDLRSLEYRAEVIDHYWGLFFERGDRQSRLASRPGAGARSGSNTVRKREAEAAQAPRAAAPVAEKVGPKVQVRSQPMQETSPTVSGLGDSTATLTRKFDAFGLDDETSDIGKPTHMEIEDRRGLGETDATYGPVVPRRRASDWGAADEEPDFLSDEESIFDNLPSMESGKYRP